MRLLLAFVLALAFPALADECRPAGCAVSGGVYHAALPEAQGRGAVLFLHGYGGSGAGVIGNAGLVGALTARGYAVIAPTARPGRPGGPASWNSRLDPAGRDDFGFLARVAEDAAARFGLERNRVVAAGFSDGGMMVWRLACDAPESFSAFAPVAGVMWRPLPEACRGPARLLHLHGWSDVVVPLEGRAVAGGRLVQGDLFASLALARAAFGCGDAPDGYARREDMLIRSWSGCAAGAELGLALHPGGHGVPGGWAGLMLDWFEAARAAP